MKRQQIIIYIITIFIIFSLWYLLSIILGSNILPDPFFVFQRGLEEITKTTFWVHTRVSFFRIIAGIFFAFILAVPAGLVIGSNPKLDRIFAPFIYLGYPIPKIVLMPVIFVLFGIGDTGKIVLLALIIFFQLLITTRDSARKISKEIIYS